MLFIAASPMDFLATRRLADTQKPLLILDREEYSILSSPFLWPCSSSWQFSLDWFCTAPSSVVTCLRLEIMKTPPSILACRLPGSSSFSTRYQDSWQRWQD